MGCSSGCRWLYSEGSLVRTHSLSAHSPEVEQLYELTTRKTDNRRIQHYPYSEIHTFIDFLTMSRVFRMSPTMRGRMPFRICSLTKHTPFGQIVISFFNSPNNCGGMERLVQPNSKGPSLKPRNTYIHVHASLECSLAMLKTLFSLSIFS